MWRVRAKKLRHRDGSIILLHCLICLHCELEESTVPNLQHQHQTQMLFKMAERTRVKEPWCVCAFVCLRVQSEQHAGQANRADETKSTLHARLVNSFGELCMCHVPSASCSMHVRMQAWHVTGKCSLARAPDFVPMHCVGMTNIPPSQPWQDTF